MSPGVERQRVGAGDRLLAQALHVERDLALALRDQHARVEDARLHHRAQALAQLHGRELRRPGPDGAAVVVEHADQAVAQVLGVEVGGVHRRPADGAGLRDVEVGEVGGTAGTARGLRHVQPQGLAFHAITPRAGGAPTRFAKRSATAGGCRAPRVPRRVAARLVSVGEARQPSAAMPFSLIVHHAATHLRIQAAGPAALPTCAAPSTWPAALPPGWNTGWRSTCWASIDSGGAWALVGGGGAECAPSPTWCLGA
jgi:hypothetical protein